ncbi:hypothetical protein SAMN04487970_103964 [Paenibacillus tianmuensis]|uniref:Uncharacterized protein n=1 Tax=Paenibacillus tianmuensis TaxID=624147 RepID=A0A1G4T0L9_9BACL|nr:hypothetical protein SAMN04487970_103964 [Paenibacillus tianmuensis]
MYVLTASKKKMETLLLWTVHCQMKNVNFVLITPPDDGLTMA